MVRPVVVLGPTLLGFTHGMFRRSKEWAKSRGREMERFGRIRPEVKRGGQPNRERGGESGPNQFGPQRN